MTMIIDVIREVEAIVSTLAQNKNITYSTPKVKTDFKYF
jgi:hypothetical protein